MNKSIAIISCCALLAAAAPGLWAQEDKAESGQEQKAPQTESDVGDGAQQKAESSKQDGDSAARQNTTGDFKPSEEISEDLSVSFPVDI